MKVAQRGDDTLAIPTAEYGPERERALVRVRTGPEPVDVGDGLVIASLRGAPELGHAASTCGVRERLDSGQQIARRHAGEGSALGPSGARGVAITVRKGPRGGRGTGIVAACES